MDASLKTLSTACPLDCPDLCSLEVTVQDQKIVEIGGAKEHPITNGYICRKVRHFAEHVHCDERLQTPLKRVGSKGAGEFEPLSWDAALDEITAKIQGIVASDGGEAVLPFCYGGSNGKLTQDALDARLFRRIKASRLARTVCAAPSGRAFAGLYGKMPSVSYADYPQANLIVVWGANLHSSGIHLIPFIREAQSRGAKLVVVDPRKTKLATQADLHLPVFPGADLPVALSVIRWLFESGNADEAFLAKWTSGAAELRKRSDPWTMERAAEVAQVSVESLECFARLYAESSPAVIRCGWGLERNRNGGSAIAAVLALPAVAGKFGCRGGGYTMSSSAVWSVDAEAAIAEPEPDTRMINMNRLGQVLLEERNPPVNCLFVYNANPLATIPNQPKVREGLLRDDLFTVVFDQVMTDTARYADIVLPATTFLEHTDYRVGYGTGYLAKSEPVIDPVGESRPNYRVFADLCDRLGLSRSTDQVAPQPLFETLFQAQEIRQSIDADDQSGFLLAPPSGANPIQFVEVFPGTPDQRVALVPAELDEEAPVELYHFREERADDQSPSKTLVLLSPSTASTINSTLGQLNRKQAAVELHPDDAADRNIVDGDQVRVFNEVGEVVCHAVRRSELKRGVAVLPKGLWSHNTVNGNTANAVAPDSLTDLGGGACFNDARVQIEKA